MFTKKRFSLFYGVFLLLFTAFVLLQAFVIPQSYQTVSAAETSDSSESSGNTANAYITENSYTSDGMTVTIRTYTENDTQIYVADVLLDSPDSLKTAFAEDTYGKNITEVTSEIAENHDAVLAINGDYYSARNGYVIRNGILYSSDSTDGDQEDLVVYEDGSMEVIREGDTTAQELLDQGAVQVFCFGPGLIENGSISVSEDEEVGHAMSSNPRTAIGWISDTHYVFVVSDGRTSESEGLTLYELAEFMESLGCETAYNLDGGGSSTMYFNGEVVNCPTTNGHSIRERSVSDIVYIA